MANSAPAAHTASQAGVKNAAVAARMQAIEDATRRLLLEWHRQPGLVKQLSYKGVPLGEGSEYQATGILLRTLAALWP